MPLDRNRLLEDLFYAHDELVALGQVFGSYLGVGVNKEEPFAAIHDGARTDSADLLAGVGHGDAVGAGVGDLLQVVAVDADVDICDDLVGGGRVEVDSLACLGVGCVFAERRRVVGGVPEIVHAPAGLDALGGVERYRVVRMDVPGVVADVDGCIDIERGALIDGHTEEGVLGPLEDDGSKGEIAQTLSDAVTACVDIGCGEHDLRPVPGSENARARCNPRDVE